MNNIKKHRGRERCEEIRRNSVWCEIVRKERIKETVKEGGSEVKE